jgi:small subunit ribosomal protein S10
MLNQKNNKLKITIRGYDVTSIEQATRLVTEQIARLKLNFSGPIPLPVKREVITVPISPHKHKDAQEQFIRKTHRRAIHISKISKSDLETLAKMRIPNTVAFELKSFF